MICLDVFEITVCTDFQLCRSGIVANDDSLFVHLQRADCPHLHHRSFHRMIKGTGLVMAVYNNHHFPCAEHSAYTYGQRCFGHFVYIVVKEAGVGNDGVGSQRFLTGTRRQGRARFVESDVSVGTDTTHKEVDTAVRLDFSS